MLWYETSDGSLLRLDSVIAVVIEEMDASIDRWNCFALLQGGIRTLPLTFDEAQEVKKAVQMSQMRFAVVRAERVAG